MRPKNTGLDRRKFLKNSVQTAAGAAVLSSGLVQAALPKGKKVSLMENGIPTRPFGKTGHVLPIFGHGGSSMVEKWIGPTNCKLLSMEDRAAMVRHGYDRGMRFFDTARGYSESERIMGEGLRGVRDDVFLATKVAVYKPEDVRESVETSLKELKTDYVDLMQIHSPTMEYAGFDVAMKIHAELLKLKDEGMLRFVGLTTHVAFEMVYKMIKTGGFDQVLLAYGYVEKGMDTRLSESNLEWREKCLSEAHARNMAIVAMKVMGHWVFGHNAEKVLPKYDSKQIAKLPGAAIRWVLKDKRISMLNIGITIPSDIGDNITILSNDLAFTKKDSRLLKDFTKKVEATETFVRMRVV